MTKGILGRKVGMTQIFTKDGILVPVTVVEATPNVVMQVKTVESDGYEAVQLGYQDKREVLSNKPEKVMLQKQRLRLSASYVKSAELSLRTTKSAQKLLWTHLRKVTLLTSLVLQEVMDTKVTSNVGANHVDQKLMVQDTTEFLAQWVPSLTVYLKASACQVTWE